VTAAEKLHARARLVCGRPDPLFELGRNLTWARLTKGERMSGSAASHPLRNGDLAATGLVTLGAVTAWTVAMA
jgi:hypothetical protein